MEKEKGFYMVFMEGGNTPAYKHTERDSAIKEARRLAETHKKKRISLPQSRHSNMTVSRQEKHHLMI